MAAIAPSPAGNGQLHGVAACFHGAQRIGKAQGSRGHMGRPFAKRVTRRQRRLDAVLSQNAPRCHAHCKNGRLGVFGEAQVFLRPLENQLESGKASASSASAKVCAPAGKLSARLRPIPTACEPWPGKRKASLKGHFRKDCIAECLRNFAVRHFSAPQREPCRRSHVRAANLDRDVHPVKEITMSASISTCSPVRQTFLNTSRPRARQNLLSADRRSRLQGEFCP